MARKVLTLSGMIHVRSHKFISILLAVLFTAMQAVPSAAAPLPQDNPNALAVVVWAQSDGISDTESSDAAEAIRHALPHLLNAHVVSEEIVEKVLSYYQKEVLPASGGRASAEENISRAKEHYFQFHYEDAMAEISSAVASLSAGDVSANGTLLQDALITQGVISKAAGQTELAENAFDRAARLNPFYNIDYRAFPPSIIELFERSKKSVFANGKGELRVGSDPHSAEVFINGILQGVTPLTLGEVPEGTYSVMIRTNKYAPIERSVAVAAGGKASVSEKLKWMNDGASAKRKDGQDAKGKIVEGLRIADLLKADKAVIIDCDGELISARMVDRKYRASHKEIVAAYSAEGRVQAIADVTQTLADLARINLLNNPMKYLDPDGIGDPVLLTGRKREFYKKPVVWGAIGAAAVGAIIGGILAASSSGGSNDRTGSVAVQFK